MKIAIAGGGEVDTDDIIGLKLNSFNVGEPNAEIRLRNGVTEYSAQPWTDVMAGLSVQKPGMVRVDVEPGVEVKTIGIFGGLVRDLVVVHNLPAHMIGIFSSFNTGQSYKYEINRVASGRIGDDVQVEIVDQYGGGIQFHTDC